jgi:hypothetical protein
MAIVDFVLLYNKAAEALAKSDRVDLIFFSGIADKKALLLKYCKQFESAFGGPFAQWSRHIAFSLRLWRRVDNCLHSWIHS